MRQKTTHVLARTAAAVALILGAPFQTAVQAEELSPEEEMARKAQDPLGSVRAIMTDNTIAFGAGSTNDDTTFAFNLQPAYAIPRETYNIIARAVVPIIGVEPGVVLPPLGGEPRPPGDSTFGLSDSMVQIFFSPKSDSAFKWGVAPQVSIQTHTSDRTAGPGWGAGVAGVIFAGSGQWSYGGIVMQHWGNSGDFSILTVQPIVMYAFKSKVGMYLGYNNSITQDWKASSDNTLTVPLGLTFGKTSLLENGNGLDLSVGVYPLVERPDNAPEWQLKFGISYFFN